MVAKCAEIALVNRSELKGVPEVFLLLLWEGISSEHLTE